MFRTLKWWMDFMLNVGQTKNLFWTCRRRTVGVDKVRWREIVEFNGFWESFLTFSKTACREFKSYYPCQKTSFGRTRFFTYSLFLIPFDMYEAARLELTIARGFSRVRAEASRKQFGELFLAKDCKMREHFGNQQKRCAFQPRCETCVASLLKSYYPCHKRNKEYLVLFFLPRLGYTGL